MVRFLILAVLIAGGAGIFLASCSNLEKEAYRDVEKANALPAVYGKEPNETLITEADIAPLPAAAQRYFRHALVIGKPRIGSFSVILTGRIRSDAASAWMPLVMRQFNRMDAPARVVYIESPGKHMAGIDSYLDGAGRMYIKIARLITVADSSGPEMDRSALVTFMNDLVLCPQAYFSLPVTWKELDKNSVELSLTCKGITATAQLFIDEDGRISDWKSEDRYADVKRKNKIDKWSTPFAGEKEISGVRIPERGAGIHDYDGTPFTYVELERIESLVLNAKTLPARK